MSHLKRTLHRRSAVACQPLFAITLAMIGAVASSATSAPVTIWNGVDGPGSLTITVGDFGEFGTALQWPDLFNPGGGLDELPATFLTHLFVFVDPSEIGEGTHRGALLPGIDGTLMGVVTEPNQLTDPATTHSAFDIVGEGVHFAVTLVQQVSELPIETGDAPRAMLEQVYEFTNLGEPLALIVTKNLDQDMPWGGGFPNHTDDRVGADFAELGRFQVYAQDEDLTMALLLLRTETNLCEHPMTTQHSQTGACNSIYYAGKQNLAAPPGNPDFPGGACPEQDYGTDFQIWDNYGVPNCWKDYVPGVGYDIPGVTPDIDGDAFIGLQTEALFGTGETYRISFRTLYGAPQEVALTIPPQLTTQTIEYGDDGCGLFLWDLENVNPVVAGEDPIPVEEFYIDVEAGDGAGTCNDMTPPDGWAVEVCQGPINGHTLYKFTGGTPIQSGSSVHGRYRVETNGMDETNNNNIIVPPLSVVMNAAQAQEEAVCNFNFGPSTTGDWSIRVIATAFLPVPAMSPRGMTALALVVIGIGWWLVRRPHRV